MMACVTAILLASAFIFSDVPFASADRHPPESVTNTRMSSMFDVVNFVPKFSGSRAHVSWSIER